jgi:tRNA A37 threonylcarbamoyladenosine dehydratase
MLEILRGSFLVQQGALRNWRLISHNIDQKVMQISALNTEIQALKSQFAETRTQAMYMRLETEVKSKLSKRGFVSSVTPPTKIIIE